MNTSKLIQFRLIYIPMIGWIGDLKHSNRMVIISWTEEWQDNDWWGQRITNERPFNYEFEEGLVMKVGAWYCWAFGHFVDFVDFVHFVHFSRLFRISGNERALLNIISCLLYCFLPENVLQIEILDVDLDIWSHLQLAWGDRCDIATGPRERTIPGNALSHNHQIMQQVLIPQKPN
jgi:hypothetical protein